MLGFASLLTYSAQNLAAATLQVLPFEIVAAKPKLELDAIKTNFQNATSGFLNWQYLTVNPFSGSLSSGQMIGAPTGVDLRDKQSVETAARNFINANGHFFGLPDEALHQLVYEVTLAAYSLDDAYPNVGPFIYAAGIVASMPKPLTYAGSDLPYRTAIDISFQTPTPSIPGGNFSVRNLLLKDEPAIPPLPIHNAFETKPNPSIDFQSILNEEVVGKTVTFTI